MKCIISKSRIAQIQATVFVNAATVICGMILFWDSPMITQLTDPKIKNHLTMDQMGWVVSIMYFGTMFGPGIGGYLIDRTGRRRLILHGLSVTFCFFGIIAVFKINYTTLCLAHFLGGFAVALILSVVPTYTAETVEDDIRGAMTNMTLIFIHIGSLCSLVLGSCSSLMHCVYFSLLLVAIASFMVGQLPESPYQLFMVGKDEDAEKSLVLLRSGANVTEELLKIRKYTEERKHRRAGLLTFMKLGNRWALMIAFFVVLTHLFSGISFIQIYGTLIFNEAGFALSGNVTLIILQCVLLFPSMINTTYIDRFGRRVLLGVCVYLSSGFLLASAIYYNLKYTGVDVSIVSWLPLITIIGSCFCTSCGIAGVEVVLLAEIFPIHFKAAAIMFVMTACGAITSGSIKIFQILNEQYGTHSTLYLFATGTIFFGTITLLTLPETKRQSLGEIELTFGKNNVQEQ